MPNRRAPANIGIQIGTKAGGVGVFTLVATVPGRFVNNAKFPFVNSVWRWSTQYIAIATYPLIAGVTIGIGVQTFSVNYQTAHRIRIGPTFAVTYCVVGVVTCLTRGGTAYTRAYIVPDPPVL